MDDITCPNCHAVYRVTTVSLIQRDRDSVSCEVCDKILLEWDAAVTYRVSMVKRGQLPQGDVGGEGDERGGRA